MRATSLQYILTCWSGDVTNTPDAVTNAPVQTKWYSGILEENDLPITGWDRLESPWLPVVLVGPSLQGPFKAIAGSRRVAYQTHGGSFVGQRVFVGVHPSIEIE